MRQTLDADAFLAGFGKGEIGCCITDPPWRLRMDELRRRVAAWQQLDAMLKEQDALEAGLYAVPSPPDGRGVEARLKYHRDTGYSFQEHQSVRKDWIRARSAITDEAIRMCSEQELDA